MPLLKCWIIEDEPPALRRLSRLVKAIRPDVEIIFTSDSVKETRRAINELPAPDLIFSDIHLADGHAFDIWEDSPLRALAKALKVWMEPIIAIWRFSKSNGVTEGLHKMGMMSR